MPQVERDHPEHESNAVHHLRRHNTKLGVSRLSGYSRHPSDRKSFFEIVRHELCNDHAKVPAAIDDKAPLYQVYTPIHHSRLTEPLLSSCILLILHTSPISGEPTDTMLYSPPVSSEIHYGTGASPLRVLTLTTQPRRKEGKFTSPLAAN